MFEQEATNPSDDATGGEGVDSEVAVQPDDNSGDDPGLLNSDEDTDPPAEESEEVEHEGKKYQIPKSLKPALLRQADYTQKTQAVAEERKAVETERAQVREYAKQQQQFVGDIAKVVAIDQQLEAYNKLDWITLSQQDPVQTQQLDLQRRALEQQRAQAANEVTQKQEKFALEKQQEIAKLVQDADAYLKREIPGWTPERDDQVTKFAVDLGLDPQTLAKVIVKNPVWAKVLHQAELYAQLAKKQAAAPKPAPEAKPVPQVTGNRASGRKDPTKMSDAEFAAYRRSVSKKR